MNLRPKRKVRWGILGTAQIAKKNWKAILNSGNGVVAAVASRDLQRAKRFVAECQKEAPFREKPAAYGTYDQLLRADDIDAIYIPLPTGIRKEWVVRSAGAGKHVLCEKPCAANSLDLRSMLEACRRTRVHFMDGVMFSHSPRLEAMREAIETRSTFGEIKRVTSTFSVPFPARARSEDIRWDRRLEPLGCLGDLGWYCIRFTLWALSWRMPRIVTAWNLSSPAGRKGWQPLTEFSAELLFEGSQSATFYCSFVSAHEQWANICGTRGSIRVDDFVLPFSGSTTSFETYGAAFSADGCDFKMVPTRGRLATVEHSNSHPNSQESIMMRTFSDQVLSGYRDPSWSEISLKTQQVVDACRLSAENRKPCKLEV